MISPRLKIILVKVRRLLFLKSTSAFDFILYYLSLPYNSVQNAEGKGRKEKKIVFVGEFLPPRIPRVAKWLKKTDASFVTVLLCHSSGFVEKFSNDSFDQTVLFRNEWHLKRILHGIRDAYILHGFAPKSQYPSIAHKMLKCPFVADMQDVFSIYYGLHPKLNWLKKELPYEKDCLLHADGIVAHSLEPNVALRLLKCDSKPRTLFFPLYCDPDFFRNSNRKFNAGEIHLVYAGGVTGSHRDPKQYGSTQFHGLIKILSEQKIHLHIYPSPSNIPADYQEYDLISKKNPFFHFHPPVHQNDLTNELAKYDFGILPFFKNQTEQSESKLKYATTLKLFNYLEAGIPILVSEDIFYQNWLIKRYQTGLNLNQNDLNNLNALILKADYNELKQSVQKIRELFSLKNQIKRIIEFYDALTKLAP